MSDGVAGNNSTQIDWSNLAGSAVSAGSGLLGSIISGIYNRKRQRESQQWAEQMYEKQNEYNLPINQVARLKEAGINPNLAFGSAASAMGSNVPSPPRYSDSPDFGAPVQRGISEYFQRRFEKAQLLKQIEWQNEQIREKQMQNDTTSLLLDDYREMKRSEYALGRLKNEVDQTLYGRQRDLELSILDKRAAKLQQEFEANVPFALANHYRAQDALLRYKTYNEYEDYLTNRSKGRWERSYYNIGQNPYETSTIAGGLRTLFGLGLRGNGYVGSMSNVGKNFLHYFGVDPGNIRDWFRRKPKSGSKSHSFRW